MEGWEVATHGGTMFLVVYDGAPFGLTAKHNLHSFAWSDLIVTKTRLSNFTAGLSAVSYAGRGLGRADGSDLLDVAIVQFSPDVGPDYFEGCIYNIDREDVCVSRLDDDLVFYGALSEASSIGDKEIRPTFAELGFIDVGPNTHDPVLRGAKGKWLESQVNDLAGMSGGPVFNTTQNALCGMTLRGGIASAGTATAHYIDIADIARVLHSVHRGHPGGFYRKVVAHPVAGIFPLGHPSE